MNKFIERSDFDGEPFEHSYNVNKIFASIVGILMTKLVFKRISLNSKNKLIKFFIYLWTFHFIKNIIYEISIQILPITISINDVNNISFEGNEKYLEEFSKLAKENINKFDDSIFEKLGKDHPAIIYFKESLKKLLDK